MNMNLDTTSAKIETLKEGMSVEVNGKEGRVIRQYDGSIWEVRLWDGFRHVGDVCVDQRDIKINK